MQKKISSIISWNILVDYLNNMSKKGLHAYERDGEYFEFEESKDKRYQYFLEKSYISIFEGNKENLQNENTEEVKIIKNKGNFKLSSFPRIYRNEISKSQEFKKQKYINLNSFDLYLLIIIFVILNIANYFIHINIAPVFIISIVLSFVVSLCINVIIKNTINNWYIFLFWGMNKISNEFYMIEFVKAKS